MKQEETPQDLGALGKITREVCYAVDPNGKYRTQLSVGWEVKAKALDVAWEDIEQRVADASGRVNRGEASPILYFMELRLMDIPIVSAYTGFWKWQVRRHLKPRVFERLPEQKLRKYGELFEVDLADLKSKHPDET
jgi:hypothetical protein